MERSSPRSAMARTSATVSASAVRTSSTVARPRPARRSSRERKSWKQRSLSVSPAERPAARGRDGGEQRLADGARPPVAGHRAVVGEDPGPLDEGVGVLERHPPDAGVAHVGQHDAGAGAPPGPDEVAIGVGRHHPAADPGAARAVPGDAPAVRVEVRLGPQRVLGAAERLGGRAVGVGELSEEAAHPPRIVAPPGVRRCLGGADSTP